MASGRFFASAEALAASDLRAEGRARGQQLPEVRVRPPGPRSSELAARLAAVESPSVDARRQERARESGQAQTPIVYARAEGANVVDVDGNVYVDLAAGFGALLLGHVPATVARAVEQQQERMWLALGDVYPSEPKVDLCERLVKLYPRAGARVMLGSTGADSVTAALKSAVLTTGRAGVVAFEGGYHGLSYGPLAACGLRPAFRDPFAEQLNTHVTFAPYPGDGVALDETLASVTKALAQGNVGAVLVEPILGRGGCVVPPPGFLPALRAACDNANALLVCDEIWTGLGRSGAWLASVAQGALPDIVCLGKGLGSGLAISACIGSGRAMATWAAHGGTTVHTATHFGAPLACAAAIATLAALEEGGLPERASAAGNRWMAMLRECTGGRGVKQVRGRGLMVGIALEGGPTRAIAVTRGLLERGWIVSVGGALGDVLTLTPPLDIDIRLLDAFAASLPDVLEGR
ncbi:MAG: aspartate aminotransferase family protein [Myxococcota bacterium]|nr:aspartate aminotransferase family protein [Myxococcota bacterium]